MTVQLYIERSKLHEKNKRGVNSSFYKNNKKIVEEIKNQINKCFYESLKFEQFGIGGLFFSPAPKPVFSPILKDIMTFMDEFNIAEYDFEIYYTGSRFLTKYLYKASSSNKEISATKFKTILTIPDKINKILNEYLLRNNINKIDSININIGYVWCYSDWK